MIFCLNPDCQNPENPDGTQFCLSCGATLVPLRNRYRVIQLLGAGGFGRTFLAEDIDKLDEPCVVKQFLPHAQGSWAVKKATELFQQEARRLQQLGEHTQIPTLYAYFEDDKRLYLVQQLIEGENLLQELGNQGVFSEEKIRALLLDLLPVLQFIHHHQVIHRDIKPDNIIRRRSDGRLVLIDFGVAKQLTATSLNHPGTNIGTLGYAPIEQMQSGEASPVSDLYSLGVTCFKLLTQASPHNLFVNNGYEWVRSWREHLPKPINNNLAYVLNKMLQKNIQQRYQSVDEVWRDLHSPELPKLVTQPPTQPPNEQTQPPSSMVDSSPIQNPMVTTLLIPKSRKRLNNKLVIGVGGIVLLLLGFGGYWVFQNLGNPRTLTGHLGAVNSIAVSRDGKTIASGSDDETVRLWNLNWGREVRTLKGNTNWVYAVAISPDGQTLASGSKDNIVKVWNLKTGKQIRTLKGLPGLIIINSVAISPDNQTLATGSYDKTVKLWNLKTGQLIRTLIGHDSHVLSVVFSPNNHTLVSGSADQNIKVWNLDTGKEIRTLKGHLGDVNAIALSPDGQMLASASDDKTIRIWNVNTGRQLREFTGHLGDINSVAFSPDGQMIASGSDDKTIKLWNLMTGEKMADFVGHSGLVFAVAFSPDGKFLVSGSADKTIKIWRVP